MTQLQLLQSAERYKSFQNYIMKKILFFILILSIVSCKKEVSATMKIHIELNDTIGGEYADIYNLKIYKNNKLFKEYKTDKFPYVEHQIELKNLSAGKYTFEYSNFFEQIVKKVVSIDDSKVYDVKLNPDVSNTKSNKSHILGLKEKEILEIKFNSRGCFSGKVDSVMIGKENGKYFLSKAKKNKLIDNKELDYLITLESNLKQLHKIGNCSTSETTIFIKNNVSDTIVNASCRFAGFRKLQAFIKRNGL